MPHQRFSVPPADQAAVELVVERLVTDDFLGQLVEQRGRAAELATEDGDVKLAWVGAGAWAATHTSAVEGVEALAATIRRSGAHHVIWTGMGGSIRSLQTLAEMGLLPCPGLEIHFMDSTDPVALNDLLDKLGDDIDDAFVIAVAMGMTSEEPIGHLRWLLEFVDSERVLVMTLPGSHLDTFASSKGLARVPVQLDGESHTPGRMSAPFTRVFLLPAALVGQPRLAALVGSIEPARIMCEGLDRASRTALTRSIPYISLAAWLHHQLTQGRNKLLLTFSPGLEPLGPWIEQVMEESLCKGGRGMLVFYDQHFDKIPADCCELNVGTDLEIGGRDLAAVATAFWGWCLTVAALGYLEGITFAGQPAVENYKRYARQLRDAPGALPFPPAFDGLLDLPDGGGYLDLTINGAPGEAWSEVIDAMRSLANDKLRLPVKIRHAPAHYHSTEQALMDGPPPLASIRVLMRDSAVVDRGAYDARFLQAQALATIKAMAETGRTVVPVLLANVAQSPDLARAIRHAGVRRDG